MSEAISKNEIVIKTENLCKNYMRGALIIRALKEVSIVITKGTITAVIGASGSGKTTLFRAISLLTDITSGKVFLEGEDVSELNGDKKAERIASCGKVFQDFLLDADLTALENVYLPMSIIGIKKKIGIPKAEEYLNLVGLGERMNHKPQMLSGGEQQRVAIARALAVEPLVILADEPTGNLDQENGDQIMGILFDLVYKNNQTVIVATHNMRIAEEIGNVIQLVDGKVIHHGKFEDRIIVDRLKR